MIVEKVKSYLKKIEKNNKKGKKINAILQVNPRVLKEAEIVEKKIKEGKAGKLAGKVITVKSNINVKGLNASCASLTLKNYTCPYDATVIKKIREEDGLIIGMANMDEFLELQEILFLLTKFLEVQVQVVLQLYQPVFVTLL